MTTPADPPSTSDTTLSTTPTSTAVSDPTSSSSSSSSSSAAVASSVEYEDDTETLAESTSGIIVALCKEAMKGIDLTRIAIPAEFLETRSLLEMYADFNAFPQLFSACSKPETPIERLLAVTQWYFSALSQRKGVKKPYNPILGEVFQCSWNLGEGGTTNFVAEQVTHHPPRTAYYLENKTAGVFWSGENCTRSSFGGTYVCVKNDGFSTLYLPKHNESYNITIPDGYGRNIIIGPIRFEYAAKECTIICPESGLCVSIEFLARGYVFGPDWDTLKGIIYQNGAKDKPLYTITGLWSKTVEYCSTAKGSKPQALFKNGELRRVKKIVAPLSEQQEHESQRVWQNVTASLREKKVAEANQHKVAIEEKQRAERKQREETNKAWETRLFHQASDGSPWLFDQLQANLDEAKATK